jgi:hypothetical protein
MRTVTVPIDPAWLGLSYTMNKFIQSRRHSTRAASWDRTRILIRKLSSDLAGALLIDYTCHYVPLTCGCRRICPGRFFALEALWIMIATAIAGFDIKKAVGADGQPEEPVVEYTTGFIRYNFIPRYEVAYQSLFCLYPRSRPLAFKYKIMPRSQEMRSVILLTGSEP